MVVESGVWGRNASTYQPTAPGTSPVIERQALALDVLVW